MLARTLFFTRNSALSPENISWKYEFLILWREQPKFRPLQTKLLSSEFLYNIQTNMLLRHISGRQEPGRLTQLIQAPRSRKSKK